jgi:hypothetical protein
MKVYVAGPMRGIPEFNYPAFNAAAAKLRALGHVVFNPAENDATNNNIPIAGFATGDHDASIAGGFDIRKALGQDLAWICGEADAVAMLPGWEASKGATAERATAIAIGIRVTTVDELVAEAVDFGDTTFAPAIPNFDTVK